MHQLYKMKYILVLVFLSAPLKISAACTPCKCYNNSMDCSRKSSEIVTKIPEVFNTEEIILLGQPLDRISGNLFLNFVSVQILNLQNCKLNFVHRDTFKNMTNLTEIDLTFNELQSLDQNIFRNNEKLVTVKLNDNKLYILKHNTFAHQKMLSNLYLQNNLIHNLTKEIFVKFTALKILNIDNNLLSYIDGQIIQNSEYLTEIYLDDNPFICDCKLKHFHQAMKQKDFNGINSKCSSPEPLKNEPLIDLSSGDFTCPILLYTLLNNSIHTYEENITISCIIEAESEPYFTWKHNNNAIYSNLFKYDIVTEQENTNKWNYSLIILNLTSRDNGAYSCTAKNTGYVNSTTFNLKINPAMPPKILIPKSEYIFVDLHEHNYTIPFKIHSIPKPVVTWSYRDKILTSNSTQTKDNVYYNESSEGGDIYWFNLTIKKVKLKYRTEFTCNVSNFKGYVNKTVALIILYPHRVMFEASNNLFKVNEMENVTVVCKLKAVPKPDVIWRYGHLKVDSNTSPSKYEVEQFRDDTGIYWSKLTIIQIETYEGGIYKCEANNSEEIESQIFSVLVNKIEDKNCESTWLTTFLIVVGCLLIIILVILILLKCCVRYHVSKNWTPDYTFRASVLVEK